MKLATTTGDFDRFSDRYLERVKYVADAGFKHIDLSLYTLKTNDELFYNDNWKTVVEELVNFGAENGIDYVQAHSPDTNNLDGEEGYRDALWKTVRSIEICGMLGIPNIVVHSGYRFGLKDKEQWFVENKKFCEELFPAMEKYNVHVLCENTTKANMPDWYFLISGKETREFVEYVDHPLFHACWDTGHANIEGPQYDEIIALGKEMYAIHFNDNRGSLDEHLIPFMGTLNVDEIMCALQKIGFKGPLTMESSSALRPSKYWLGNRMTFAGKNKMCEPTKFLQQELEKFMYSTGKHILETYQCFED